MRPDDEHGWALVPFDVAVLPRTRLAADTRQVFAVDVSDITALRVQAYPDGGIARVRAHRHADRRHGLADSAGSGRSRRDHAVDASDCAGLWRRTLLIEADGSRDTGTDRDVAAGHHRLRRLARLRGHTASAR